GTRSWAMARRRKPDSPTTSAWPITSDRSRGRMRSASGAPAGTSGSSASGGAAGGSWSSKRPGMVGRALGDLLDLHPRVVEAGAAAEIGPGVGGDGVGRRAGEGVVAPQPLGEEDDAGAEVRGEPCRRLDRPEVVSRPHAAAVRG